MPAKENGTNQTAHTHIFPSRMSPEEMGAEEKTAQNALAQDCLAHEWANNPRWKDVERPYTAEDVLRLRGSIHIEHTLARLGAERLWELLQTEPYVKALGAVTGNQAVQQVQAGLQAIYVSGWQVAADANNAGQMYPDQSLYPADSVPNLCRRINSALQRADQVHHAEGKVAPAQTWFAPLVADAEAGFGGTLNAFELMKGMIEAGAACVHFEDQLSSAKKCGHLGGKVLVPTSEAVQKLVAARLAADVMGVPTLVMARTDADSAHLLTSDIDARDRAFCTGERTSEGFYRIRGGIESAIARGLAYAPYADLIWCETSHPDLEEAREFADAIHARYPGKMLAYNCSPSFNWRKNLDEATIACFQQELARHGIQVPVRDSRRLPRAEPQHVRTGARLQDRGHDRLFSFAGKRVQPRNAVWIRGGEASALRRDWLLRSSAASHQRRASLNHSSERLDRSRAIRRTQAPNPSGAGTGRSLPAHSWRLPAFAGPNRNRHGRDADAFGRLASHS